MVHFIFFFKFSHENDVWTVYCLCCDIPLSEICYSGYVHFWCCLNELLIVDINSIFSVPDISVLVRNFA
jgi:hypothetical protein